MNDGYWSTEKLLIAAIPIAIAYGPVLALVLAHRTLGPLKSAAWLVSWGSVVIAGEHTNFGFSELAEYADRIGLHAHYHWFMNASYTLVAAAAIALIAHTLLREGRPVGWYAILGALLLGGGLEVVDGITVEAHGLPPDSIPLGFTLYAYFAAWISALAVSYRPVFRNRSVASASFVRQS